MNPNSKAAHPRTAPGSLSPSDGERVGERGFEFANIAPPLPGPLLHPMEEREKTGAVRGCVHSEVRRVQNSADLQSPCGNLAPRHGACAGGALSLTRHGRCRCSRWERENRLPLLGRMVAAG